jgi:DNA adenine methylase
MKYMGSKNRIAKHILPIILKDRKPDQWYVEPFVGGANMIDKVDGKRIGSDSNEYLICLLKALQDGYIPPDFVTEDEYKSARIEKNLEPRTAFIGFGCSYSGKWFGGYARNVRKDAPDAERLNMTTRNYCGESKRNLLKQLPNIIGINFLSCGYKDLEIPINSIIYCDPPYANTTSYKDKFSHEEFWQWCRDKKAQGHTIFISEYNAPEDFECVWEKEVNSSLTKDTGAKKATEKLFTLR